MAQYLTSDGRIVDGGGRLLRVVHAADRSRCVGCHKVHLPHEPHLGDPRDYSVSEVNRLAPDPPLFGGEMTRFIADVHLWTQRLGFSRAVAVACHRRDESLELTWLDSPLARESAEVIYAGGLAGQAHVGAGVALWLSGQGAKRVQGGDTVIAQRSEHLVLIGATGLFIDHVHAPKGRVRGRAGLLALGRQLLAKHQGGSLDSAGIPTDEPADDGDAPEAA